MRKSFSLTLWSSIIGHSGLLANKKTLHTLKVTLFVQLSHHSLRFQNAYIISQLGISNWAHTSSKLFILAILQEPCAAKPHMLPVSSFGKTSYLLMYLTLSQGFFDKCRRYFGSYVIINSFHLDFRFEPNRRSYFQILWSWSEVPGANLGYIEGLGITNFVFFSCLLIKLTVLFITFILSSSLALVVNLNLSLPKRLNYYFLA